MFGKNAAKQQQQLAQQQQTTANAYLQQANTKSPLELAQEQEGTDWLADTNSPTFDITKTRGMNPYLSAYNNAVANRDEDMAGSGILRLGTNYQNPQIAANYQRLLDERRRERAGGALENAFRMKDASVRGDIMPLLGMQTNRNLALSGQTSGSAADAWRRYLQAQQTAGFTNSNLFNQIMAGSRSAAAAMAGGG